ncbi:MAG: TonB-dependent receptor [Prevotella sp.]|nr:TonB-dependent receptor [Prevotella sp.]
MCKKLTYILLLLLSATLTIQAQTLRLSGRVYDADTDEPIEFASILLSESGLWAVTDSKGEFTIKNVPEGKSTLTVQCLGYQKRTMPMILNASVPKLSLRLKPENLKLREVTVIAKRKTDEATTSYTIDRQTLDNQQILNISDIQTLLPGGKTINPSLMNDNRMSLRSGSQEKGNASFGTAIEIDGLRLDNNAVAGETMGASTRTLSASNIESVEIVTGIPSVEYGDLSNGVVKVNTRKGKSPFIVEGKINQHTRQLAVNKGFDLGSRNGVLNASVEHARSFQNAASPHTAYQRNIVSLHYMNTFMREASPLTLNIGVTGNLGGYNSEADPDEELDDYNKVRDNALRSHIDLQWLLNKKWITNLSFNGSFSYSDRKSEDYEHASSASTQPYLHATEQGYFIPTPGPTGYWYVKSFNDSKPLSWALKLKAEQTKRFGSATNRLMIGVQYTGSRNNGRGTYYDSLQLAPSWREYRYDELPTMHNLAFYAEEKGIIETTANSSLELTAGLRNDNTIINGSDYGTVSSLSPRFNGRYIFWRNKYKRIVNNLEIHAGWGKSVKLPSMQVLYPRPVYSDLQAFASTSTADNTSYYVYHTYPSAARYNPDLQWQYTNQTDLGIEATIKGTRVALSFFHHRTYNTYMATKSYTPFTYRYTGQTAVQNCGIPAERRVFSVDQQTGTVTVSDAQGVLASKELDYTDKNTYVVNQRYENGTPLDRYGLEWIVDFARIKPLMTSIRLDGNYYYYKGMDHGLYADIPLGVSNVTASGQPYQYVGYYRGAYVNSAGTSANASVSNGFEAKQLNLNATLTTHVPKIRLIVALRLECSLYNYKRDLSEGEDGATRGYLLESGDEYAGAPYDGTEDKHVAVYPEYYSTWENPTARIPFAERFLWAKDNDPKLYNDLAQLVVRSNYAYTLNPNRLSAYYSANLSITKEIGDHVSVSFYANNFFNTMRLVHSSQTDLEESLFNSRYVPNYYYGLSLRLKI